MPPTADRTLQAQTRPPTLTGYAAVFEFDELEDFDNRAEEVLRKPGPVIICVKAVPDIRGPQQPSGPVNPEVVRGRPQAISNLLREFGQS